jgi:hypothetical protein
VWVSLVMWISSCRFMFEKVSCSQEWKQFHLNHYDWWMFPIDKSRLTFFGVYMYCAPIKCVFVIFCQGLPLIWSRDMSGG